MMKSELMIALRVTLVTLVLTGSDLSARDDRIGASDRAPCRQRQPDHRRERERDRLGIDRAEFHESRPIFSRVRRRPTTNDSSKPKPYNATNSAASNYGPTSQALYDRVKGDVERLQKENPDAVGPVPDELVTTSASGLDPHLSPEAALWQVPRIAKARGVKSDRVEQLVRGLIEGRTFGLLGEPRVNVLSLNLELDKVFGRPAASK